MSGGLARGPHVGGAPAIAPRVRVLLDGAHGRLGRVRSLLDAVAQVHAGGAALRDAEGLRTRAGTPAFMAPEQPPAEWERVVEKALREERWHDAGLALESVATTA